MFFLLSFLFCKSGQQEGKTSPAQREGLAPMRGGVLGERGSGGEYSAKNVYICM
jgi:hypothetical protein